MLSLFYNAKKYLRTVGEIPPQSIRAPWKIRQFPYREAIALPRIDTFSCQQKEMGHKGGQR